MCITTDTLKQPLKDQLLNTKYLKLVKIMQLIKKLGYM